MNNNQYAPGYLTLETTAANKVCDINLSVPPQIIYLTGYKIEFDTAAHALSADKIYVNIGNILSRNHMLDDNLNYTFLPLSTDNALVTIRDGLRIPIYMTDQLPETFVLQVFDSSFANTVPTGFARVRLHFELSRGHIG